MSQNIDLPEGIFRTYDIRGIVDEDLTADRVRQIGLGLGLHLAESGAREVVVGHDVRESSPVFSEAMAEGLCSAGLNVTEIHDVPTPVLYWAVKHLGCDGGVMITGSHNPINYNGLKITRGLYPIWGDELQLLHGKCLAATPVENQGSRSSRNILDDYLATRVERFSFPDGFKVAIDCGNGTAGPVILPLFEKLGIEVDALYAEPDGTFPNHLPDPEVPKYMKALCDLVAGGDYACGFGFDGDSDRVGLIDENGKKISADLLLLAFARHLLNEVPGGKIIFDVKCSDDIEPAIVAAGGEPILSKTGHSIIKERMRETGAILAGELSGHICVNHKGDGFDDAFFAALLTLEIMAERQCKCSDLFADIPEKVSTPEVKIPVSEEHKFGVVDHLVEEFRSDSQGGKLVDLDGVRLSFPDGWMLIRASNTTANLTARIEGEDRQALIRIGGIVEAALTGQPVDLAALHDALAE